MSTRATIAIPCYNSAPSIAQSVQSALSQTWLNKEVIVVDDGSSDNSLDVLHSFGNSIRVIRSEHLGGNGARNLALRYSTGEWLQFLDADDYLHPLKIEQQFEEAGKEVEADVIYSPVHFEASQTTGTTRWLSPIDNRLDIYTQWIAWQFPQTGGALWRKSTLVSLGGWKEGQPCCQEHELYLRALKAGRRFVLTPSANAIYRIWSDETVCRKDPRLVVRVKSALIDEMLAWLISRGLMTYTHQLAAGRAFFEMARTLSKYDLEEASAYHSFRKSKGLINLGGPAAHLSYRLAYHAFGFAFSEHLAGIRRRSQSFRSFVQDLASVND